MRVLFSTGERSGAVIARPVRQALERIQPDVECRWLDWSRTLGPVLGFWAGLRAAKGLGQALTHAVAEAAEFKPDVAVLVSYSGLHLRLGRKLRAVGIRVAYVAPPQVWAWGANRTKALKAAADQVVCLFSFEKELLVRAGLEADYFGYPLLDLVGRGSSARPLPDIGRYVAFLPGSRPAEVRHHLPLFSRVFELLQEGFPTLQGVLVGPSAITILPPGNSNMTWSLDERYSIMAGAACLVAVSGTVTAEAAILGVPMVVCYHLSLPATITARVLVRTRYFALPNILAGRQIVPELLNPSPGALAARAARLLADEQASSAMRNQLGRVRAILGPEGATERIARLVLALGQR
ncbi:MAG: hypothetical protein ABIK86_02685 [candidate division WOR-3 bacterium]